MSIDCDITTASSNDLPDLVPLFDAYRRFYSKAEDYSGAAAFLRARLEQDQSVIFLARQAGKAVGFTQLYPTFSSVSMRSAWILNDLFVAESVRGSGVGAALMKCAQRHAESTGAKGLQLETAIDNLAAQALYEKLGWKRNVEFHRSELEV